MKEKEEVSELELKNARDIIEQGVQRSVGRCRELISDNLDVDVKYGVDLAAVCQDNESHKPFYFQICKIKKKKGWWTTWETITPFCFIKDKIKKSMHSQYCEYWLEIELYGEIQLLSVIRQEMELAASKLGAKTRVISVHRDENKKLTLEEYI